MDEHLPSTKPYLVRAIHEWCTDNGFTPYVAVTVDSRTVVPQEHVQDGQIVLNVGVAATGKLLISNDALQCTARFNGSAREIYVPMLRISAIYAKENGAGMGFEVGDQTTAGEGALDSTETEGGGGAPDDKPRLSGRPRLQRVK